MPKPNAASLAQLEEEFRFAELVYREKLNNLTAAAKAILASQPQDGVPNDPNDPIKGRP